MQTLQEQVSGNVWVLDTSKFEDKNMDYILAAIQTTLDGSSGLSDEEAASVLKKYFKNTNKPVIDISKYQLTVVQTGFSGGIRIGGTSGIGYPNGTSVGNNASAVGTDLVFSQTIRNVNYPQIAVRLVEFNARDINRLIEDYKNVEERYVRFGNDYFLVQYPVSTVEGIVDVDNNNFKVTYSDTSILEVNLKELAWYKKSSASTSDYQTTKVQMDNGDYITPGKIHTDGTVSNSQALIIIDGLTTTAPVLNSDPQMGTIEVPKLVLRDYLEATYQPGVVQGETLVMYGRRIRLDLHNDPNHLYSKSALFGYYWGTDPDNGLDMGGIYASDLCDPQILVSQRKIYRTRKANESTFDNSSQATDDSKLSNLPIKTASNGETVKILNSSSDYFPGLQSGQVSGDASASQSNSRGVMYYLTSAVDINSSGLYASWISNSDIDKNSTEWWLKWLKGNGYMYTLDSNNISEYLESNFNFSFQGNGNIVWDLDTIDQINKDYEKQDNVELVKLINTIFLILGLTLQAYSVTLLLAWQFDMSQILDINLLNKLSFGHWTAVGSYDESGMGVSSEITFGSVLKYSIFLISLGIIFEVVNISALILALINLFGVFGQMISGVFDNILS